MSVVDAANGATKNAAKGATKGVAEGVAKGAANVAKTGATTGTPSGTPTRSSCEDTVKKKRGPGPTPVCEKGFIKTTDTVVTVGFLGHRKILKIADFASLTDAQAKGTQWLTRFREAYASGEKLSVKDAFLTSKQPTTQTDHAAPKRKARKTKEDSDEENLLRLLDDSLDGESFLSDEEDLEDGEDVD